MLIPVDNLPHDAEQYEQFNRQFFTGPHVDLEDKIAGNFIAAHFLPGWAKGQGLEGYEEQAMFLLNNMYGNYVGRGNDVDLVNGLFSSIPVHFTGEVYHYLWGLHDAGPGLFTYQTMINILRSFDPAHADQTKKQILAMAIMTGSPTERMIQVGTYDRFISYMDAVSPEIKEYLADAYRHQILDVLHSQHAKIN